MGEVLEPKGRELTDRSPAGRGGGPDPLPRPILVGVTERDAQALRQFFDHYADAVHGLAYRLVGETLVRDVTQEVFFKVYRAAHRLDPDRDPRNWLNAITYNTCREFWRSGAHKLALRTVSMQDKPEVGDRLSDSSRDPEQELLAREREEQVQAAILSLPDPLRASIILHDYQGVGHEEIARMTGVTHVAARKRYSRALAELARILRDEKR